MNMSIYFGLSLLGYMSLKEIKPQINLSIIIFILINFLVLWSFSSKMNQGYVLMLCAYLVSIPVLAFNKGALDVKNKMGFYDLGLFWAFMAAVNEESISGVWISVLLLKLYSCFDYQNKSMILNKLKLTNSLGVYVKAIPYLVLIFLGSVGAAEGYVPLIYLVLMCLSIGLLEDRRISDIYVNKEETGYLNKHLILRLFMLPVFVSIKAKELLAFNEVLVENHYVLYIILASYLVWYFVTLSRKKHEREFILYQISTLSLSLCYIISNKIESVNFVAMMLVNMVCILLLNMTFPFGWHKTIVRTCVLAMPFTPVFIYKLYLLNDANFEGIYTYGFVAAAIMILPMLMLYTRDRCHE